MQTLEITRSGPQDFKRKQSVVQTPDNTGLICRALWSMDINVQFALDYEGTIPPVLNYEATSQDDASTLPPAPSNSATTYMTTANVAPFVMPDAPRSTANILLEAPCPPSHPPPPPSSTTKRC